MNRLHGLLSAVCFAVMAAASVSAADIATGPAVGETIPRFEARDQTGAVRTFDSLKGPDGLLLLFFRTADW